MCLSLPERLSRTSILCSHLLHLYSNIVLILSFGCFAGISQFNPIVYKVITPTNLRVFPLHHALLFGPLLLLCYRRTFLPSKPYSFWKDKPFHHHLPRLKVHGIIVDTCRSVVKTLFAYSALQSFTSLTRGLKVTPCFAIDLFISIG